MPVYNKIKVNGIYDKNKLINHPEGMSMFKKDSYYDKDLTEKFFKAEIQ